MHFREKGRKVGSEVEEMNSLSLDEERAVQRFDASFSECLAALELDEFGLYDDELQLKKGNQFVHSNMQGIQHNKLRLT